MLNENNGTAQPVMIICYLLVCFLLMSFFFIALQSVELDRLAVYLDSNIIPWHINKTWEDLLPSEWFQVCMLEWSREGGLWIW